MSSDPCAQKARIARPVNQLFRDTALASNLAKQVDFGNDYTCPVACGGAPCTNIQYNCSPFDLCIDSSDVAKMAADIGSTCGLASKAGDFSKQEILAWFGMVQTDRRIEVAGMQLPEIAVVDHDQMERAISDPYGYRTNPIPTYTTAASTVAKNHWSQVKQLYR